MVDLHGTHLLHLFICSPTGTARNKETEDATATNTRDEGAVHSCP